MGRSSSFRCPPPCLLLPASCSLPPAPCLLLPASCSLPQAPCLQLPASCFLPPAPCLLPPGVTYPYYYPLLPAPSLLPGRPEREHLQAAGDLWPGEAGPAQGPRLLGAQILRELLHTLVGLLVILCVSQETCSGQHFLVTLLWHFSKILKTLRGTF